MSVEFVSSREADYQQFSKKIPRQSSGEFTAPGAFFLRFITHVQHNIVQKGEKRNVDERRRQGALNGFEMRKKKEIFIGAQSLRLETTAKVVHLFFSCFVHRRTFRPSKCAIFRVSLKSQVQLEINIKRH